MRKKHNWKYANAQNVNVGCMVCTHCQKPITSGDFRYRETDEAYKPQHRACSESDSGWDAYDQKNTEVEETSVATFSEAAKALKKAFFEGFDAYASPAAPYNCAEDAWEESEAKKAYNGLMAV